MVGCRLNMYMSTKISATADKSILVSITASIDLEYIEKRKRLFLMNEKKRRNAQNDTQNKNRKKRKPKQI